MKKLNPKIQFLNVSWEDENGNIETKKVERAELEREADTWIEKGFGYLFEEVEEESTEVKEEVKKPKK